MLSSNKLRYGHTPIYIAVKLFAVNTKNIIWASQRNNKSQSYLARKVCMTPQLSKQMQKQIKTNTIAVQTATYVAITLAQTVDSSKDGQRDTMHNNVRYTITM